MTLVGMLRTSASRINDSRKQHSIRSALTPHPKTRRSNAPQNRWSRRDSNSSSVLRSSKYTVSASRSYRHARSGSRQCEVEREEATQALPALCPVRHTALTRRAEAGCDVFTLARIAGHSSITITERYVHPQADALERAFQQTTKAALPALPAGANRHSQT